MENNENTGAALLRFLLLAGGVFLVVIGIYLLLK
jgi:hypothetical protein